MALSNILINSENLFRFSSAISSLLQDLKADFPVIKICVIVYEDKYISHIVYEEREDKHRLILLNLSVPHPLFPGTEKS